MAKLGKRARKFAKKNLQSVLRKKRKLKSMFKRKNSSVKHRDDIERSSGISSKQHAEENFAEATTEAAPYNSSFDSIYIEDGDLVEDGSNSEGFLSEVCSLILLIS
ncbi:hypothetical protein AXF42_Ash020384 [Apostasia shenzhenica]|uniref:Uncharacterized protein n=1 Tax=Apostasia shenzhenica TaxID=1088818 RepID=A0A2I0A3L8_9ASPA|nr:hypothetical protein AXF42_Ash020384 [Apostasia shenzhenica]